VTAVLVVFLCTSCCTKSNEPKIITELNQKFEASTFNITATNIRVISSDKGNDSGSIIGVEFLVENTSKGDIHFGSRSYPIQAYVNDFEVVVAYGEYFGNSTTQSLTGRIMSGRKAAGYYSVYAPFDAEVIEVQIRYQRSPPRYVIFKFDVPPVEVLE